MSFRHSPLPKLVVVFSLLLGLSVSLSACTAPDTVISGDRPNKPTEIPTVSVNPETDPARLTIPLTDVPSYLGTGPGADGKTTNPMTGTDGTFTWWTADAAGLPTTYQPDDIVAFGDPQTYTKVPGVLTFRGNNYRNAPAYGTAAVTQKKLNVTWTQDIGEIRGEGSYWPGAGWTGQPLLVNWPKETRDAMGFDSEFADKDLVEVIYPVFEGKIYRLDLETGKPTKPAIDTPACGYKGTGSIDPRGYPLLYTGQGLHEADGIGTCPWEYRIFDLIQNKQISGWSGDDPARPRADWGAFDSSALVNAASDTLIEPSENGLVYKAKLNAKFDPVAKTVSVNPELARLRYDTSIDPEARHGIESSAVAYRNLMFASDNDGNLICWDANTLAIIWVRDVGDDSDATMVLEETPDGVFLYHGNTVDKRGQLGDKTTNLRKINALTGELIWQYDVLTQAEYPNNGGLLATPALGQGEVADLVFFNVAKTRSAREGDLYALDKITGKVVWQRTLGRYSWSSPVLITSDDGHQYGILCDSGGTMHLFDPNTGYDLDTVSLGKNVESSPAVFGNMIVVASYAKKIWAVTIS
ncbi:MAG: PQQ-binding-like beta-propeller repeat protein [Propionibacteriaceae bacterium]|jgi:outer membrane protein assembly factor BamB|nr:PQQ-binding-like beta-propeller repeat protein [Propionibacteriaceae bacterium]